MLSIVAVATVFTIQTVMTMYIANRLAPRR